jgi:hypothetical protein
VKGDKPGENFQGGVMAAPLAIPILRAYFAKPGEPVPGVTESTQVAASFP